MNTVCYFTEVRDVGMHTISRRDCSITFVDLHFLARLTAWRPIIHPNNFEVRPSVFGVSSVLAVLLSLAVASNSFLFSFKV